MQPTPLSTSGRQETPNAACVLAPTQQRSSCRQGTAGNWRTTIFAKIFTGLLFALAFYPAVAESQATVTNARAYFFIEGADLDTVNARLSFPELALPATTIETTPASMFAETVVTTSYQVVLAVRDFTPYSALNEDLTTVPGYTNQVSPNTEIQYYVYRSGLTYTVPDGQRSYISGNPSGSGGEYRMRYYIQATTETCTQLRGQTATCRATAPPTTEEVPNTALNFTLTVLNSLTLNASYSSDGHTTAYPLVTDQPLQKGDNQYLKITRATLDSGTMRNTLIAHRISSSCRVSSAANAANCADSRIEKKTGHVKTFGKEHSIPTGTSLVPTPGQGSTTLELSGSLTYPGFYPITYEPHYTTLYQGEVPATVIGNSAPYIRLNVAQNSVPGLVSALPANFSQYRLDTTFEFPAVTRGNGALIETLSGTLTLPWRRHQNSLHRWHRQTPLYGKPPDNRHWTHLHIRRNSGRHPQAARRRQHAARQLRTGLHHHRQRRTHRSRRWIQRRFRPDRPRLQLRHRQRHRPRPRHHRAGRRRSPPKQPDPEPHHRPRQHRAQRNLHLQQLPQTQTARRKPPA